MRKCQVIKNKKKNKTLSYMERGWVYSKLNAIWNSFLNSRRHWQKKTKVFVFSNGCIYPETVTHFRITT